MKKLFIALLFACVSVTGMAQNQDITEKYSVATNSFWSNWYVSAGVLNRAAYSSQEESALSGNPFSKERNSFGFELGIGKWFTPGIGLRTQFQGLWGKQATWRDVSDTYRYMNIHEDVMFNLSNLLYGYNERRVWNFIPYAGIGFARNFSYNVNTVSYNLGIQNTWRLSRHFSVYFDVSAMLAPADFDGIAFANPKAFRMRHWDKSLHFSLGLTYRLGKKTGAGRRRTGTDGEACRTGFGRYRYPHAIRAAIRLFQSGECTACFAPRAGQPQSLGRVCQSAEPDCRRDGLCRQPDGFG